MHDLSFLPKCKIEIDSFDSWGLFFEGHLTGGVPDEVGGQVQPLDDVVSRMNLSEQIAITPLQQQQQK